MITKNYNIRSAVLSIFIEEEFFVVDFIHEIKWSLKCNIHSNIVSIDSIVGHKFTQVKYLL